MNDELPETCADRCEPMVRAELGWKQELQRIADDMMTGEEYEPYFSPMDYSNRQKHEKERERQLKARELVLDAVDTLNNRKEQS